jgi:hypothetical protein
MNEVMSASVLRISRATSRAASWTDRITRLPGSPGQHCGFSGLNLLVRDVLATAAFLQEVFEVGVHLRMKRP